MENKWSDIRKDFPILNRKINERPLIYFDNAATSQKPIQVLTAIKDYYEQYNANVYRSVHTLSGESTDAYEEARVKVKELIHAKHVTEIIFTRGTTGSLNQLARSLSSEIKKDDEILLSYMEHHSNIIPWQQLAKAKGAKLKYIELTEEGRIDLDHFKRNLNPKTKIVSFTHVSNILGVINPVKEMTQLAHENQSLVIIDGAQAIPHLEVDVCDLDADFYVFSGHKMLGPTGIGILYGKKQYLEKLEPAEFGGEMIELVEENDSTWASLPNKFEAGTPNISGAIGFGAAIDYYKQIGINNIFNYESELSSYLLKQLTKINDLNIYGPTENTDRIGVVSFNIEGIHPHDLSTALDLEGIAIRAGHHCGQLLMKQFNVPATSRISLSFYNTKEEIDFTVNALNQAKEFFK